MHAHAIHQIDRAAITLLQALAQHGDELRPYLEGSHLETLHAEVVNLRRALLGLQMGPLYWDMSPAEIEEWVTRETLALEDMAARAVQPPPPPTA